MDPAEEFTAPGNGCNRTAHIEEKQQKNRSAANSPDELQKTPHNQYV